MIEMDTSLAEARLARGLTLEDAERSTRITRKYLVALEEQNYAVFPAPVYARGFLRTYCRYLGIDPEPHLAGLPAGWNNGNTTSTQLPPVSRPMTFNVAWVFLGVILVGLAAGVFVFLQNDRGLGDLQTSLPSNGNQTQEQPAATDQTGGNPSTGVQTGGTNGEDESMGRPLDPGLPGILPDFDGVTVEDAMAYLQQQDIAYLVIDETNPSIPQGLIFQQTPDSGSATDDLELLTLTASLGEQQPAVTRADCGVLGDTNRRSAAEQTWFESNCGVQEQEPAPGPAQPETLPDRTICEEIRGTDYRSPTERQFFLANCIIG